MLSNMGHMRRDLHYGSRNKNRPSHGSISHGPEQNERFRSNEFSIPNKIYAGAHRGDSHIKLVPSRQRNAKHAHRGLKPVTNYNEFNPMAFRFGFNPKTGNFQKRGHTRSRWLPKIKAWFHFFGPHHMGPQSLDDVTEI